MIGRLPARHARAPSRLACQDMAPTPKPTDLVHEEECTIVDTIASFCADRRIPTVLPRLPNRCRSEGDVVCWQNGVGAALRCELTHRINELRRCQAQRKGTKAHWVGEVSENTAVDYVDILAGGSDGKHF